MDLHPPTPPPPPPPLHRPSPLHHLLQVWTLPCTSGMHCVGNSDRLGEGPWCAKTFDARWRCGRMRNCGIFIHGGKAGRDGQVMATWPPRSADDTHSFFFPSWFLPSFPLSLSRRGWQMDRHLLGWQMERHLFRHLVAAYRPTRPCEFRSYLDDIRSSFFPSRFLLSFSL